MLKQCHRLKSNSKGKKTILKLSRRKDSDVVRRVRSKLKTIDLKSIGITTPVYLNDSLCFYYIIIKSYGPNVKSYGEISLFSATWYQMVL